MDYFTSNLSFYNEHQITHNKIINLIYHYIIVRDGLRSNSSCDIPYKKIQKANFLTLCNGRLLRPLRSTSHYHCGQSAPDYGTYLINGVGLCAEWNVDIVFVGKTFIIVLDIPDVQQKNASWY
jgi:hypothetical protein